MNLLTRTNTYYVLFSVITYIVIACTFYLVVEYVIYQEVEERLRVERHDFEDFTIQHGVLSQSCYFVENKVELKKTIDPLQPETFKDTLLYNRYSGELDPFREYSFVTTIGDTPYRISIRKSLIESKKLLTFITGTMLILLSVGLSLLYLFQRRTSKKLWQPFYTTLSTVKAFELTHGRGVVLAKEDIVEFNELNSVLEKMTDKISKDYRNLKEFTENAAHEIQTPLALIYSRIEELIQQKNFSHEQMAWIQDIHHATTRLSKLHQAILLLSKIDNGQFYEHEAVDFSILLKKKLSEFEEIFTLKNLKINFSSEGVFVAEMNNLLADVLLTNLLNNAVKHNLPEGVINITLQHDQLIISNTGLPLTIEPERLFERFKKQNQASGSLGLGLAIVKKICENFGLSIDYRFEEKLHTIVIFKRKL